MDRHIMLSRTSTGLSLVDKLEAGLSKDACPSHNGQETRKTTSIPASVLKELVHSLSSLRKHNIPEQSSTAALLPPELLICIFEFLVESVPMENSTWRPTGKTRPVNCHLKNAALVCRAWHPLATILLYGNVTIVSQPMLKTFEHALKKSPSLKDRIHSFSYMTPGCGLNYLGKKKKAYKDQKTVVSTCMRLTPSTSLNLQLWEPCADEFFNKPSVDLSRLTGLRLVSTPFSIRDSFGSSLTLPNLQSLTIEFGCFIRFSDWPKLPQLKSLRLVDAMLFHDDKPVDCSALANITRLELNHVLYQSEALMPLLQSCASELEHLMIVDLKGPDYLHVLQELKTMKRLRTLVVGPNVFYKNEFPLQLPPNLEELSIRDSIFTFDLFNFENEVVESCEGLRAYLESGVILPETLRKISARGMMCDWEECDRIKITKLAEVRGVIFEYEEFKFSAPTVRRVRWRTRFWQSIKRKLRMNN